MGIFYHIDRLNKLKVDQEINLIKYDDVKIVGDETSTILQEKADQYFPNGVSSHGEQYFIKDAIFNDTSVDIELVFELIRRNEYSDKNSRFESFFAVEKENIITMLNRLRTNPNLVSIYEVESEEYFRGDMNLLIRQSNLVSCVTADLYWQGKTLGNPLYEILMKPPIRVLRKVNIGEILR